MPDTGSTLLMALGLDLGPFKAAAETIRITLENLNNIAKQVETVAVKDAGAVSVAMGEIQTKAEAAVAAAIAGSEAEKGRTAAVAATGAEMSSQIGTQEGLLLGAKGLTAEEERRLALAKLQTAELRQQLLAQRAATGVGHAGVEENIAGGLLGNVTKGILGEGTAGRIAGGLLAGAGIASAILLAGDALQGFLNHLREVTVEAGKLTVLEEVFKNLAAQRGITDSAAFMDKLREATHGLVGDMQLLQNANVMLRSHTKLTQDQMVQMTADVTKLSIAAGHDATQSINMMARGLERGNLAFLSATLAIPGLREAVRSLAPGLSTAAREAALLRIQMEMIQAQARKTPELAVTLGQELARLKNAWSRVEESFGKGINESPGMKAFIASVDNIIERLGGAQAAAYKFGAAVGDAFAKVGTVIEFVVTHFNALVKALELAAEFFIAAKIVKYGEALFLMAGKADMAALAVGRLKVALVGLNAVAPELLAIAGLVMLWHGATGMADEIQRQRDAQRAARKPALPTQHINMGALIPEQTEEEPPDEREALRRQLALMQERIAQAKEELTQKRDHIQQMKALDDEAYQYQHESLAQHLAQQRTLIGQEYEAEIAEARTAHDQQRQLVEKQYAGDADVLKAKLATLDAELATKLEQAKNKFQMSSIKFQDEWLKDQMEAQQRAIEGALKTQTDALARAQKEAQTAFQQGATSPDEYLDQQLSIIRQLADAKIDAANREFRNGVDNDATREARVNKINAAIDEAQSKIEQIEGQEAQMRIQAVERQFAPQQKLIESAIGALQPGQSPVQYQQQMAALLQQEREALDAQLSALPQLSDQWFQVLDKISQVYQTQQKYNDELRKSQDLLQPIADGLSSITKLLGTVWTSHFVKGLVGSMEGGIAAIKGATQAGETIKTAFTGKTAVPEDPALAAFHTSLNAAKPAVDTTTVALGGFKTMLMQTVEVLQTARDKLAGETSSSKRQPDAATVTTAVAAANSPGLGAVMSQIAGRVGISASGPVAQEQKPASNWGNGSMDEKVQSFATALTAAIGELTNFADSLTKASSAAAGALGGGTAGYGVGQMANNVMSAQPFSNMLGGMVGSASTFMPFVGAAAGMITGIISGQKNAEMSSELSELNSQYTSIMDAFHSNTDNLQEAIIQMQELIAEAQVDEANSKKGGSAFASLISQYSQQLIQLQDQQKSIISNMEVQLAIFSTPSGMQQFLTNLQNIIEQYDKFYGAAQNAKQLADANSWLTESLSSYTTQMENTFVQDEEQGIQDALNLNSLLSERSTLISNLNNSIMNVLEQGVLTRQQTQAQKKGQQIEQLESQASLQLTSINNEISLEQYKVAIETSLYNLAMTSMGLQAQLLSLQEGQASQSLAAIAALQQLIAALQGGSYNLTSLSGILSLLGYGGAAGNIPPSGTTNPTASAAGLDALAAAAYQSRATLGYGAFRGVNL